MERKIVVKNDILLAFKNIGIKKGDNIIVHTSLGNIGFVCGGAQVIIECLLESVGREGTIVMPSQTWKNLDPSYGVHWEEPKEWWGIIRENWPAYDKEITPTNTMGATAEMFRKWPGAIRSNHPVRSFAAVGKNALKFMENHSLTDIFGESSPLAKMYEMDSKVLLIGVTYDKNTSMHLADVRANYPRKHNEKNSCAMMVNGTRKWVTYDTLYVDGEDFCHIGKDFENIFPEKVKKIMLGNAEIRYMKQRDIVDYSVKWIENNRN